METKNILHVKADKQVKINEWVTIIIAKNISKSKKE
jgi:hypothetical protein